MYCVVLCSVLNLTTEGLRSFPRESGTSSPHHYIFPSVYYKPLTPKQHPKIRIQLVNKDFSPIPFCDYLTLAVLHFKRQTYKWQRCVQQLKPPQISLLVAAVAVAAVIVKVAQN